ncbi:MAG: hypothetical protein JW844_05530 [Candidatus Omnitrophica bacterium]|nr:hypothetical protein [Candidatus Omnitrophota bacterium]
MWFSRARKKSSAKKKEQDTAAGWVADATWIEKWVNRMLKRDRYFFYKRWWITEEQISFANPIDYIIELSREVVKNLGLPSRNIVAAFSGIDSAGKIECQTGKPYFIEISDKWKDNRTAIAAIIAHEMTHAWMDDQGLREADTQTNEKLTDITAILLGLGVLLVNGLEAEKITAQWYTENFISGTRTDHKRQLRIQNYISDVEMGIALSIFAAHKNIEPGEVKKKLNSAARTAFDKGHREFMKRQAEIQDARQVESWIVLCPGCFQKMRLPNHDKNIILKCPVCSREARYSRTET